MLNKKQKYIFWGIFAFIFIGILLVASFLDLQISELLAAKDLPYGEFYSTNKFARFFEIVGEMPLYIFIMFACCVLIAKFKEIPNKWLRFGLQVFFFIVGAFMGVYGGDKFFEYIYKLNPENFLFYTSKACLVIVIFINVSLMSIGTFFGFYKYEFTKQLVGFAIIILVTAAVSQGLVQGIKPFWGRERFRAINVISSLGLQHQGFTPWYIANGNNKAIIATFPENSGITSTYFTSFPSGHTACAGITYVLMFLPVFFKKLSDKKISWIFIALPILITGTVALSRIVMGAHYLSDVLFGGTFAFLASILGYYVVLLINKKVKIL